MYHGYLGDVGEEVGAAVVAHGVPGVGSGAFGDEAHGLEAVAVVELVYGVLLRKDTAKQMEVTLTQW